MFKRFTLNDIAKKYKKSIPTVRKYFAKYNSQAEFININNSNNSNLVNLVFDATFFKRDEGFLIFRANGKNIHAKEVKSEKVEDILEGLNFLTKQGYSFKSFTVDGRKGVIANLKKYYPNIPIQLCQFHQSQIIRRYITSNPRTECGIELKMLMKNITLFEEEDFKNRFQCLWKKYESFLKERNENNQFMYKRLRSAFRSLKTNLPYLFTCKNYPDLQIPNTTNSCEGSFGHWKSKIKIHRGLNKEMKSKMVMDLIKKC